MAKRGIVPCSWCTLALAAFTLQACGARDRGPDAPRGGPGADIDVRTLAQPTKLVPTDAQKRLTATADAYFRGRPQVLTYVQVDKPLYQPGETIWYRAHVQQAATLTLSLIHI